MEGEQEYSFWHLLVKDVLLPADPPCRTGRPPPRGGRLARAQAGDRAEDLADVLAHHYLQALELARAAGQTDDAEDLAANAIRYLALAGERALGLDTARAETRLAQALGFCPPEDPQHPELLRRWAEPALQAGRPRDAATALEEALAAFRASGETEGEARVLIQLSRRLQAGRGRPRRRPHSQGRRPARGRQARRGARRAYGGLASASSLPAPTARRSLLPTGR